MNPIKNKMGGFTCSSCSRWHPTHPGAEACCQPATEQPPKPDLKDWSIGFNLGCAVAYIANAASEGQTAPLAELRKAKWNLDRVIERMEKGEKA